MGCIKCIDLNHECKKIVFNLDKSSFVCLEKNENVNHNLLAIGIYHILSYI